MSRVLETVTRDINTAINFDTTPHQPHYVTHSRVVDYCPECGQFYDHWLQGDGSGPMRSTPCDECYSAAAHGDSANPVARAANEEIAQRCALRASGDYGAEVPCMVPAVIGWAMAEAAAAAAPA